MQVDGRNQTRYGPKAGYARYKVQGPAPTHELKAFVSEPGFDLLHGVAHSAEYDAVHERRIFFVAGEYWLVADVLYASEPHTYDQTFHLTERAHQRIYVSCDRGSRLVRSPNLLLAQPGRPDISLHQDAGYVSYRYGHKQPAPVMRFSTHGCNAVFFTVLYPHKSYPPALTIKELARGEERAAVNAVRVLIEHEHRSVTDVCAFAGDSYWVQRDNDRGDVVQRNVGNDGCQLEQQLAAVQA